MCVCLPVCGWWIITIEHIFWWHRCWYWAFKMRGLNFMPSTNTYAHAHACLCSYMKFVAYSIEKWPLPNDNIGKIRQLLKQNKGNFTSYTTTRWEISPNTMTEIFLRIPGCVCLVQVVKIAGTALLRFPTGISKQMHLILVHIWAVVSLVRYGSFICFYFKKRL